MMCHIVALKMLNAKTKTCCIICIITAMWKKAVLCVTAMLQNTYKKIKCTISINVKKQKYRRERGVILHMHQYIIILKNKEKLHY